MDEREVARVRLTDRHQPTGRTKHFYGLPGDPNAVELPAPTMLRIVQYDATEGLYLFYCGDDGIELTDTWHESFEDAQDQAEFEFTVRPDEWLRA